MAAPPLPQWLDLGLERDDAGPLLQRSTDLLAQTGADGRARLRWYVPTDAAVILGRGQRDAADVEGLRRHQRPSGGGAVLMDDDLLSLDVTLPADHPWLADDDMAAVFDHVGAAWAAAMTDLGVPDVAIHRGPATASRLGPPERRPLAEICYASLGRGEVTSGGRKLVGLSQRRRREGALIQCGVHHRWKPDPLIHALGVAQAAEVIRAAAVGLDDLLPVPVSDATVVRAVTARLSP
jgi:lipoate-protein ligase A